MYTVPILPERVRKIYHLVVNNFNDFKRRGIWDGTIERKWVGAIGEDYVLRSLGMGDWQPKHSFDGGYDIEGNYIASKPDRMVRTDVKTIGRKTDPKPWWINNVPEVQTKYDVHYYLFCSFNKRTYDLTVCGYIPKWLFMDRAKLYRAGTKRKRSDGTTFPLEADNYEIRNNQLIDISDRWALQSILWEYDLAL